MVGVTHISVQVRRGALRVVGRVAGVLAGEAPVHDLTTTHNTAVRVAAPTLYNIPQPGCSTRLHRITLSFKVEYPIGQSTRESE